MGSGLGSMPSGLKGELILLGHLWVVVLLMGGWDGNDHVRWSGICMGTGKPISQYGN